MLIVGTGFEAEVFGVLGRGRTQRGLSMMSRNAAEMARSRAKLCVWAAADAASGMRKAS